MSAFVSVIVPVYNIEDYLKRCIDSILAQTYENFELLLVDDGSTDKSGAICDSYLEKDERVRVFHKANGGSSSARNMAILEAKGEYLSFVDSDDYVEPDFLECLVAPIERAIKQESKAPLMVQVGRDEIDENGNQLKNICTPPVEEEFVTSKEFFKSLIMHIGDCSFCTKVIARELFEGREFPVGKLNEDFRLLIQMLPEVDGLINLPGTKYHVFYRMGSNSRKIEKNNFSGVFKDSVDNADLVEEIVSEHYPDMQEIAIRFALFQRLEYLLHIPIIYMREDYSGYKEIVNYVRGNFPGFWNNHYLSYKNKVYLTLFSIAPKGVRKIHAKIKHL